MKTKGKGGRVTGSGPSKNWPGHKQARRQHDSFVQRQERGPIGPKAPVSEEQEAKRAAVCEALLRVARRRGQG